MAWHQPCSTPCYNRASFSSRLSRCAYAATACLEATMKRLVLVGALVGALGAGVGHAQTAESQEKPARKARTGSGAAKSDQGAGHTAPKSQPETAPAPT